jgi:hypothetical protein
MYGADLSRPAPIDRPQHSSLCSPPTARLYTSTAQSLPELLLRTCNTFSSIWQYTASLLVAVIRPPLCIPIADKQIAPAAGYHGSLRPEPLSHDLSSGFFVIFGLAISFHVQDVKHAELLSSECALWRIDASLFH